MVRVFHNSHMITTVRIVIIMMIKTGFSHSNAVHEDILAFSVAQSEQHRIHPNAEILSPSRG